MGDDRMAKNIDNPDELNSMVSIYDLRAQKGKLVKVESKTAHSSMCEKLLKARMVSQLFWLLFFFTCKLADVVKEMLF